MSPVPPSILGTGAAVGPPNSCPTAQLASAKPDGTDPEDRTTAEMLDCAQTDRQTDSPRDREMRWGKEGKGEPGARRVLSGSGFAHTRREKRVLFQGGPETPHACWIRRFELPIESQKRMKTSA